MHTVRGAKIGTTGETPGSHVLEAAEDGQCDGRGGCGFADGVGEKKIKKRAAGPTQGRAEKKEDQDMGVIASGCRIAWHMGPFGGVSGYCTGRTVPPRTVCTRTRAAATPRRHDTQLRFLCPAGKGGGGEKQPPPSCHPSKPVRASRVATHPDSPGKPRPGSYRSTRSALGTALFAKTCRTSTR